MLSCLLISLPAIAAESDKLGFWFEGRVISNGSSSIIGLYEGQLTDAFGFYLLADGENNRYWQTYGGPTWKPLSWIQLGIGAGRESTPNSTRRNAFVSIKAEKVYGFATFEEGGSGPWHRVHAIYHLTNKISAGGMDESLLGFGPRVEYKIKNNITSWGTVSVGRR